MLYNDDCLRVLKELQNNSIDLIFADPPYFLSNNGISINTGKIVSVNKGEWDKKDNYNDTNRFTFEWLKLCYEKLKPTGTIWVSGTHHNIFDVEREMIKIGFQIINIIVWQKIDPPPLIYKNKFKFSHELIIWAKKDRGYTFNYKDMFNVNSNEMGDVWLLSAVQNNEKKKEKRFGYHTTQKPEKLLERIILASSKIGETVLDPFMGSGTTGYVATKLKRRFIGIEKETEYFNIAVKRIDSIKYKE